MSKLTEEIKRLSRKIDNIDQRVEKIEKKQPKITVKVSTGCDSSVSISNPKFKVGDKFIPHKPKDWKGKTRWDTQMDRYNGKIMTVTGIANNGNLRIDTDGEFWHFDPSWCTKVEEPKFKVGDKFIPHKPKFGWVSLMDKYDGKILTITGITRMGNLMVDVDDWLFNPSWCTKVEEPKFKKGDWVRSLITGTVGKVEAFYEEGNNSSYLLSTIDGKKFTSHTNKLEPYFPKEGEYFHVVAKNSREEGISFIPATSEEKALLDSELAKRGLIFDGKEIVRDNTPKVGDFCIFWAYNKKESFCDILEEITNFSENRYCARCGFLYHNCIKFESIEQFRKIKEGKI